MTVVPPRFQASRSMDAADRLRVLEDWLTRHDEWSRQEYAEIGRLEKRIGLAERSIVAHRVKVALLMFGVGGIGGLLGTVVSTLLARG